MVILMEVMLRWMKRVKKRRRARRNIEICFNKIHQYSMMIMVMNMMMSMMKNLDMIQMTRDKKCNLISRMHLVLMYIK
jgi:hypothetical protein